MAAMAIAGLALAPVQASADRDDQGRSKHSKHSKQSKHSNPAPPKKNGRHDNRDWNKRSDDRDRHERDDDRRRIDPFRSSSSRLPSAYQLQRESERRQQTKNEWRNIAYLSGAVAVLGLLNNDKTLTFAGAAGALYSLHRYEADRKSQSRTDRLRAEYFSRSSFVRDGRTYNRRVMVKNGERYYQFVRK